MASPPTGGGGDAATDTGRHLPYPKANNVTANAHPSPGSTITTYIRFSMFCDWIRIFVAPESMFCDRSIVLPLKFLQFKNMIWDFFICFHLNLWLLFKFVVTTPDSGFHSKVWNQTQSPIDTKESDCAQLNDALMATLEPVCIPGVDAGRTGASTRL